MTDRSCTADVKGEPCGRRSVMPEPYPPRCSSHYLADVYPKAAEAERRLWLRVFVLSLTKKIKRAR